MRQAYLIDIWHMIVVVVVVIYHKTNSNIDIFVLIENRNDQVSHKINQ